MNNMTILSDLYFQLETQYKDYFDSLYNINLKQNENGIENIEETAEKVKVLFQVLVKEIQKCKIDNK